MAPHGCGLTVTGVTAPAVTFTKRVMELVGHPSMSAGIGNTARTTYWPGRRLSRREFPVPTLTSPIVISTSDCALTETDPNWERTVETGDVPRPGVVPLLGGSDPTGTGGSVTPNGSMPRSPVESTGNESVAALDMPISPPNDGYARTAAMAATRRVATAAPDQSRRCDTGSATCLLGIRAPDDVGVVTKVTVLADDGSFRDWRRP